MNKITFIKSIELIKENWLYITETLHKANLIFEDTCPIYKLIDLSIANLAFFFPEPNYARDLIEWWCWDRKFGEKKAIITISNKLYEIKTAENLYNIILEITRVQTC